MFNILSLTQGVSFFLFKQSTYTVQHSALYFPSRLSLFLNRSSTDPPAYIFLYIILDLNLLNLYRGCFYASRIASISALGK